MWEAIFVHAMRRLNLHHVLCFIVFSIPIFTIFAGENVHNYSLPGMSLFPKLQAIPFLLDDLSTIETDVSSLTHGCENCLHLCSEVAQDQEAENQVLPPINNNEKECEEVHMPMMLEICCGCKVIGHAEAIKKKDLHKKGEVVYNMRN